MLESLDTLHRMMHIESYATPYDERLGRSIYACSGYAALYYIIDSLTYMLTVHISYIHDIDADCASRNFQLARRGNLPHFPYDK